MSKDQIIIITINRQIKLLIYYDGEYENGSAQRFFSVLFFYVKKRGENV